MCFFNFPPESPSDHPRDRWSRPSSMKRPPRCPSMPNVSLALVPLRLPNSPMPIIITRMDTISTIIFRATTVSISSITGRRQRRLDKLQRLVDALRWTIAASRWLKSKYIIYFKFKTHQLKALFPSTIL